MAETGPDSVVTDRWSDDNPWYLVIVPTGEEPVTIDLGIRGWSATHADLMRVPGIWLLVHKASGGRLSLMVHEGEQPYYTAHHVGVAGSGGTNEVTAYGIGKKQRNGEMMRLWVLPNGMICGGDDVDDLGLKLVHALGPRTA